MRDIMLTGPKLRKMGRPKRLGVSGLTALKERMPAGLPFQITVGLDPPNLPGGTSAF